MNQRQSFQWNEMTMGTCYYPEHWDESLWESDLLRMKDAGISVIRIAEFSWSILEPEEGKFCFGFFDRFLELCSAHGMKVIFGTPTATPPAWLTESYPEVLNGREDGVLYRHGGRRHYNYNSEKYRELTAKIVTQIASHYGKHPAIVGWQIDNEINCETAEFYSEADTEAFRGFLQKKYGTLEALNKAWGTVFWSQSYTGWGQLHVPRPLLNQGYNPHLCLDYFRFISESALAFCRLQAEIIRRYRKPGDFITTNGMFGNLDNHRMEEECLDVYTYDSYPSFAFGLDRDPLTATDLNDRQATRNLTEVRSICPHFGIMEQQSGANGWTTRMEGPAPRPGQLTLWAMQSVAQGADYVSFFRWRTCTFGTEIYWHGILDYDNRDNRKLAEVKDFYHKLKTLDEVCGADFGAAFGLVKDYDNIWDAQADVWHRRVAEASEEAVFEGAELLHTPYDVIYLRADTDVEELSRYPVLLYPHPVIMTKERAELLKAYVEQGGTLILGCRSGYKQENGKCVMLPQPGLLRELTGSDVREFTFAGAQKEPVYAVWDGKTLDTPLFHDIMELACDGQADGNGAQDGQTVKAASGGNDAQDGQTVGSGAENAGILAVYANGYCRNKAALIEKRTGRGRTLHFGSTFSRENLKQLLAYAGVPDLFGEYIEAPETVELVLRRKGEQRYLFVLNFEDREAAVRLKRRMTLLYDGQEYEGEVVLAPYGTAVYRL